MKKVILSLALIIVIVLNSFVVASASAKTSLITADKIDLSNSGEQTITVKIIGNTGIMGFRLRFEYDPAEVEIVSVQPGGVTSKGNFNHNLGLNSDRFDVLWNNVSDVKGDGAIVVLKLKALSKKTATIKIAYSQPDTFNQDWEDVQFKCEDITYKVGSEEQDETTLDPTEKSNSAANKKGTNSSGSSDSNDVIADVKDKVAAAKEKAEEKGSNAKSKEDSTFQTEPVTVPKSPEKSKDADKQQIGGTKDVKMIIIIVVALVLVVVGVVVTVIRKRKSKKLVEKDIKKGH